MTWEIALGIIALCGFCITTGTLAARLASALARLEASVRELSENIAAQRKSNDREHEQLRAVLGEHGRQLTQQDLRLHDLECGRREGEPCGARAREV